MVHRGDRLRGLAEPHLVPDEAAPGAGREEGPRALTGMERDAQKAVEGRAVRPARERARDPIVPLPGVAHLGHERECILVAPERGLEAGCLRDELLDRREGVRPQHAGLVEVARREANQGGGRRGPRTEAYRAAGSVREVNFAVRQPNPLPKHRPATGPALEPCERELDVLAGPELVDREVRAGAEVVARLRATDGDAVGLATRRVGDPELGDDRVRADVLQAKALRAAELPASATCHDSSVAPGGGWVRDSFAVAARARRLLRRVPPPASPPRIPSAASMQPLSQAPVRRQCAAGRVAGSP
jgi:hypothetical protein